jgi:predicted TPR repeat methyltransferase
MPSVSMTGSGYSRTICAMGERDTDPPRAGNVSTVEYYERHAHEYALEIDDVPPPVIADPLRRLAASLPAGAQVLEVGSGTGRDADFLETLGPRVRRTDVTRAFVDMQIARGLHAEQLDLITDELGGPYDAIVATAVLIHIERARTDDVLTKVAAALRPRGAFLVCIREGTGEERGDDCHMTYWPHDAFVERLERAGLRIAWHTAFGHGPDERWLTFLATRP